MSETESFIQEVTEEVRRDRLFRFLRRYGWIAVVGVILLVGGAAWNEWRKAEAEARAQRFGDALLAALKADEPAARAEALAAITPEEPGARVVLALLRAGQLAEAGRSDAAAELFRQVAVMKDTPEIYRQIAAFRALLVQGDALPPEERRSGYEALARPGAPLRLLAEEQIALIEVETGAKEAAIERLKRLMADSEATQGLKARAGQLIVALGGSVEPQPAGQVRDG